MKRSGIDRIKCHTGTETPYGNVTKTRGNFTHKRAKRSVLSQQVTTMLEGTDKTL